MRRVERAHAIWSYEHIVRQWASEGMSAMRIRDRLREEHDLYVGIDTVQTVIPRQASQVVSGR